MNEHTEKYSSGWHEGMSDEDSKNLVYWERNMLALVLANLMKETIDHTGVSAARSGWYFDTDNNWDGWKRVISINNGSMTFHIPDEFEIGDLPEIDPNWDGHTTKDKWEVAMSFCGVLPRDYFMSDEGLK